MRAYRKNCVKKGSVMEHRSRLTQIATLVVVISSWLPSSSALAQNCDALIAGGIYDIHDSAVTKSAIRSYMDWFCDEQFASKQQSDSFGSSLGFPFKGVPVKLDIDSDHSSWEQSYRKICSEHRSGAFDYSAVSTHVKTINPGVVDAFIKCTSTHGLHVWLERSDGPMFHVAAKYNNPGSLPWPKITEFLPGPNVKCDLELKNRAVTGATFRVPCTRLNDNGVLMTVNAEVDPLGGDKLKLPAVWHPPPPSGQAVFTTQYLSDLKEMPAEMTNRIHGGLRKDSVYWQPEVWMGNSRFYKALGIHPEAGVTVGVSYQVPAGANWFKGLVGNARQDSHLECRGSFVFRVLLNNATVASDRIQGSWQVPPVNVTVPVAAGQVLTLDVTDGGDGIWCDHMAWGDPRFEK
jgi:hypothetical protein